MIVVEPRVFEVEPDDFPLTLTASTGANELPELANIACRVTDQAGGVKTFSVPFRPVNTTTAKAVFETLSRENQMIFTVIVRFPAEYPMDRSLDLLFESNDHQRAKDRIRPGDVPIVFGNFVIKPHETSNI